ncbi:DUF4357 domain-containing protein [Celerinatantimonas sp. YJH-8]|uniref:DUF4357 domain-containing protein n=1 Tax=Celerinatantimonas sp. YJH-8 TaxID=3228714 RepID=UPI0038C10C4D
MDKDFDLNRVNFIVDNEGRQQAAIIPIDMYHQLQALQSLINPEAVQEKIQADFQFEVKRASAYGYPAGSKSRPQFVVTKGSTANLGLTESMRPAVRELREQLLREHVLVETEQGYEFLRDHQFASPSLAACLIAGNARSGLDAWKDQWGRSLKDRGYGKKRPKIVRRS